MGDHKLAYIGLGVSDVGAWQRFATGALGLGLGASDASDDVRLRFDGRGWRIALHASSIDDILYAGFELADERALADLRLVLKGNAIEHASLETGEAKTRGVDGGLWIQDPDGLRLEFVYGGSYASAAFASPLACGYVTGDQGLGHIVVSVSDLLSATAFYQRLGFAVSDYISVQTGPATTLRIAFMHSNSRHHTIALAQLPGSKRLNHIMIELIEIDDVIRGQQRCAALGYATGGLGRHPNDRMLSFYVTSPAGFDIEYGWGGEQVGDDSRIIEYDKISLWGHERPVVA